MNCIVTGPVPCSTTDALLAYINGTVRSVRSSIASSEGRVDRPRLRPAFMVLRPSQKLTPA